LDAWLTADGRSLRISEDRAGSRAWPTLEEASAQQAMLAARAEVEQAKAEAERTKAEAERERALRLELEARVQALEAVPRKS
jgi:hypothetical protein